MGYMLLVAGIIATISGIIGGIDYDKEYKQTQEEIKQQKDDLQDQYFNDLDNLETKKKIAVKSDMDKAARLDENADIKDKILNSEEIAASDQFNQGVEQIQAEQENNLFNWNNALASIGANEGNELAAIANNGTRAGSSLSKAVEMEAAANTAQLSLEMSNAQKQQQWSLGNLFNQNKQAQNSIWQGRVEADQNRYDATDLRNSWEEGGLNWQSYEDQAYTLGLNYKQNKDALNRAYNRNKENYGWGLFSAIMTAGNKGFGSGMSMYNTAVNGGKS